MSNKKMGSSAKASDKVDRVTRASELLPAVVIIHKLPDFTVQYMSPLGLKLLNQDWNEISGMSNEEYHRRYFNVEDAKNYIPRLLKLLGSKSDDSISFFQQVKTSQTRDWDWYMSAVKIMQRDTKGNPDLLLTLAMQVDPEHYFSAKAARLLDENVFLRENHQRYHSLTRQERSVLKLLALGKRNRAIAAELSISPSTVETHRKRIKNKLKARSVVDMLQYARVFRLI